MKTLRNTAKEAAMQLITDNLDTYNEWAHRCHTHVWIEVHPDGSVHQTEEANMQTCHYIDYPDNEVASILDIARCEYCDCDGCASYNQAFDDEIDGEEFEERWGYPRKDVDQDFAQHLKDCELYDYDMADNALAEIDEIPYGYFDDED